MRRSFLSGKRPLRPASAHNRRGRRDSPVHRGNRPEIVLFRFSSMLVEMTLVMPALALDFAAADRGDQPLTKAFPVWQTGGRFCEDPCPKQRSRFKKGKEIPMNPPVGVTDPASVASEAYKYHRLHPELVEATRLHLPDHVPAPWRSRQFYEHVVQKLERKSGAKPRLTPFSLRGSRGPERPDRFRVDWPLGGGTTRGTQAS